MIIKGIFLFKYVTTIEEKYANYNRNERIYG